MQTFVHLAIFIQLNLRDIPSTLGLLFLLHMDPTVRMGYNFLIVLCVETKLLVNRALCSREVFLYPQRNWSDTWVRMGSAPSL